MRSAPPTLQQARGAAVRGLMTKSRFRRVILFDEMINPAPLHQVPQESDCE